VILPGSAGLARRIAALTAAIIAAAAIAAAAAPAALAAMSHATLVSSYPQYGAVLPHQPARVTVSFDQPVGVSAPRRADRPSAPPRSGPACTSWPATLARSRSPSPGPGPAGTGEGDRVVRLHRPVAAPCHDPQRRLRRDDRHHPGDRPVADLA